MKANLTELQNHFKTVIEHHELSHAYLFNGPANSGKTALTEWLAMRLFCENLQQGLPCGHCAECLRVKENNNPDYLVISSGTKTIGIDDIRHLKQELSKSGLESQHRIFVVKDADKMTIPAANSLLKFLEEPVSQVVIVLTTSRLGHILPTIQSRVQIINFQAPSLVKRRSEIQALGVSSEVSHILSETQLTVEELKNVVENSDFELLQQVFWRWLNQVFAGKMTAFPLVQMQLLPNFKEPLLQQIFQSMLVDAFSDLLAVKSHLDRQLNWDQHLANYEQAETSLSMMQVAAELECVLQVRRQLEANVSFQNVLEQLTLQLIAVKEGN